MPRYVMEGFGLSGKNKAPFLNVDKVDLVLNTNNATTFSYEYINGKEVAPDISGNFTLKLDGQNITNSNIGLSFGEITWGAGMTTQVLALEDGFSESFIAPVSGDRLPKLAADNGHVMIEFLTMLDATATDSKVKSGPYAEGKTIKLKDFFEDDTTGSLQQGSNGNNTLSGGAKDDLIVGQAGADKATGGGGRDTILLGRGADEGYGGVGGDVVFGYTGDDDIWGGAGNDGLYGDLGGDRLWGGGGKDALFGGSSGDRLDGGGGNDKLKGGNGGDVFVFADGSDKDKIKDFGNGADTLRLNDNLWNGNKTAEQVVDQFATKGGGNIIFDFGGGDILVVEDYIKLGDIKELIDIF